MGPINFGLLSTQIGAASAILAFSALLGWAIWWFVRKRRQRVWLPTLRIMELESRRLPKLRVIPPPWLMFLCFVLASLALIIFGLRPSQQVFTPFEPSQNRIHFFLDLSPSVSAHTSVEAYRQKVQEVFANMEGKGRITATTSLSGDIFEATSGDQLKEWLQNQDFHRAGLKLGVTLRKQIETLGDIDRLFIFSDEDQSSWDGFNWQFLMDDMEIVHVVLPHDRSNTKTNLYVDRATFLSSQSSLTMDWDVEVAVSGTTDGASGQLQAALEGGDTLATVPFSIPGGRDRASVTISWPASAVRVPEDKESPNLVFTVSSGSEDAITLDNSFRTNLLGAKQEVLLVAESGGEMILEDAGHHLKSTLEVLGFRVKRLDRFPEKDISTEQYPLWIILGGGSSSMNEFCPQQIERERLQRWANAGEGAIRSGGKLPMIWLAPISPDVNFQNLCWCFAKLVTTDTAKAPMPEYCEDVTARDPWIGVLSSLGAKQVGGQMSDMFQSLAWHIKDKGQSLEVSAFTIPLQPGQVGGLSYAGLPLVVRTLLQWNGLLQGDPSLRLESWPRLSDPVTLVADALPQQLSLDKMRLTNVPIGESRMIGALSQSLPPQWSNQFDGVRRETASRKDQNDPMPWLFLCSILVLAAVYIEGIFKGITSIVRMASRRKEVLALLLSLPLWDRADAQVRVMTLGDRPFTQSLSSMAREVAARTSIDLETSAQHSNEIDESAQSAPWLWTDSFSKIAGKGGAMTPGMVAWLKRGGFLIIQRAASDEELQKLTANSAIRLDENEGWRTIPPDHELMRSFHLLESLPACPGQMWRGFHFDGRLGILVIPHDFLSSIGDQPQAVACLKKGTFERDVRVFINILMVALTTDYKKDQIHLPEILKRLR